jgi:PhnB protein
MTNKEKQRKTNMSKISITPYLFFGGRCQEALEFYQTTLDAKVDMLMLYNQSPEPATPGMLPAGFEDKVMHATFHIGETTLQASDSSQEGLAFKGFSLSLTLPTEAEAKHVFTALSEGGKVQMPLEKTFWSPCFGMVTDKFGMDWMVGVATEEG